jgi:hypothetical protein
MVVYRRLTVTASPLTERTYNKIKENIETTTTSIAERENVDEQHVAFLRWRVKTEFAQTAKEGDQIILKFNNKNKTRAYVYPPSTILEKQVIDGFVYFFHDCRDSENKKVGWTRFQSFTKRFKFDTPITGRTKSISGKDIENLMPLWI